MAKVIQSKVLKVSTTVNHTTAVEEELKDIPLDVIDEGSVSDPLITQNSNIQSSFIGENIKDYNAFIDQVKQISIKSANEVLLDYRKTKIINKSKLNEIISRYETWNSYTNTNWFLHLLYPDIENSDSTDYIIFIETALNLNIITSIQYYQLVNSKTTFYDVFNNTMIKFVIDFQNNIFAYLPSEEDLLNYSNIENIIKTTLNNNPNLLLSQEQINKLIQDNLIDLFNSSYFIPSDKINNLYLTPNSLLTELNHNELTGLLNRVRPYLDIITDEEANILLENIGNETFDVTEVLQINEIKLILDKDLDIKSTFIHLLDKSNINYMFDTFKMEMFENDFKPIVQEAVNYNLSNSMSIQLDELEIQDWINNTLE